MKQQLTEQERFDLMIYRMQRAHETMEEALLMSRESFTMQPSIAFIMPVIMQQSHYSLNMMCSLKLTMV